MPVSVSAALRCLLPAVVVMATAGCGTLRLRDLPSLISSRPETTKPADRKTDDRDYRHVHRGGERSPWPDRKAKSPAFEADSSKAERERLLALNDIIDRDFPGIDKKERTHLLQLVDTYSLRKAEATLRYLGGQYRLKKSEERAGRSTDDRYVYQNGKLMRVGHSEEAGDGDRRRQRHPDEQYDDWANDGDPPRRRRLFRRDEDERRPRRLSPEQQSPPESADNRRPARFGEDLFRRLRGGIRGDDNRDPANGANGQTVSPDPSNGDWNAALKRLLELSKARAARNSDKQLSPQARLLRTREQVFTRMLQMLSGDDAQAVSVIPGMEKAEAAFWQDVMLGMSKYFSRDSRSDPGLRAYESIKYLRRAVDRLSDTADLEIRNLNFCTKINSFGNYETVESSRFRAGEQALIYAEIENFKSELTKEGRYKTLIKSTIAIYHDDRGGRPAAKEITFTPTKDICRERRRDYFHSYVINLPRDLRPGNYLLKLTVSDVQSDKVASDTIRFKID